MAGVDECRQQRTSTNRPWRAVSPRSRRRAPTAMLVLPPGCVSTETASWRPARRPWPRGSWDGNRSFGLLPDSGLSVGQLRRMKGGQHRCHAACLRCGTANKRSSDAASQHGSACCVCSGVTIKTRGGIYTVTAGVRIYRHIVGSWSTWSRLVSGQGGACLAWARSTPADSCQPPRRRGEGRKPRAEESASCDAGMPLRRRPYGAQGYID